MRLLASYSQCTVIGIDYTLSPEARFPQAIEEIVAACCYFHQQAHDAIVGIEIAENKTASMQIK
ncbi:alpha/beta hydrolase fold domain-containing protein [Escherichia coli]|uniref:alpha/beta hydrolase fold domain-containing protein n=1 Tax=Escherichia coli TaxID=562 RepID=UPI003D80AC62